MTIWRCSWCEWPADHQPPDGELYVCPKCGIRGCLPVEVEGDMEHTVNGIPAKQRRELIDGKYHTVHYWDDGPTGGSYGVEC